MGKYAQKLGGKYSKKLGTPVMETAHKRYEPPQPPEESGVFQQLLNAMGNTAPPVKTDRPRVGPAYDVPASVSRLEKAQGAGTALEVGLPFLAAGLSAGASIPATGSLTGLGTLAKEYMMDAYGGQPTSTSHKFKSAGGSVAAGMLGQGFGVGGGKVLQKVAAPLAKYVEPQSLQAAKKMGIKYTPSEVLKESGVAPALIEGGEKVIGSMVGGGAVLNPLRTGRLGAIKGFMDTNLDNLITTLDDPLATREIAKGGLEASTEIYRKWSEKLYDLSLFPVAEAAGAAGRVPNKNIISVAESMLKQLPQGERIALGKSSREMGSLLGMLERAASLPPAGTLPFREAHAQRSLLKSMIRDADTPIAKSLIGGAKRLEGTLNSEMKSAAKRGGFIGEFEVADRFTATARPKFDNAVIQKLAKIEPEKLAGEVVKPRNAESIKEIRSALGEDAFNKVKRLGIQDWIEKASITNPGGDVSLSGKLLVSEWRKLGPATKNAAFSNREQSEITGILETIAKFETTKLSPGLWGKGQAAGVLTGATILGGGAVGGALGGVEGAVTGVAAVALGPAAVAKMITSDKGRKWLTEGFKIKPGTKEAINFMGRFSAWLADQNTKE